MDKNMIAWYPFNDEQDVGKDCSGNGRTARAMGTRHPAVREIGGRKAAVFEGGEYGVSYLELPEDLLKGVGDENGLTVSVWVYGTPAANPWERIFDFGKNMGGPYIFLTRFLRGVCFRDGDLAADAGMGCALYDWTHITMTVTGTKNGSLSSAGPRVYVNGDLMADGFISQTSSGTYKRLREWLATFEDFSNYSNNYIGHSQFSADADFCGAMSDFRIYGEALDEDEILSLMCESLTEQEILKLAKEKYLPAPARIITKNIELPKTLIEGRVSVEWNCDHPEILSPEGVVSPESAAVGVSIHANLSCGKETAKKCFHSTVLPPEIPPYELTVYGGRKVLDISKTLFGLFFEDINNAADGGIYAEMVQNRSFEAFAYYVYDARSGENGISDGRNHDPLQFWFGDLGNAVVKCEGGLNEHFNLKDPNINAYYIEVKDGMKLYNRGFCDRTFQYSMNIKEQEGYRFSIWAKADKAAKIRVVLMDGNEQEVSNALTITVESSGSWKKYSAERMVASKSVMGQLCLAFEGDMAIDMVSLMPENVWGAKEEALSATAHSNFAGNSNYRLRRDMVEALAEIHPSFLRFPGGCISEGSYIWENVYDWKESVGAVEVRKENYNVWGYMMTMGLGYMEYFQLSEDLGAEPLPVMACGVLCQARSDYANPAGGELQKKYIDNFTDLIDFAISTDFEHNKWAALRKEMGHEAPFGLHYLGVGNENWGTEFFANFEAFKYAIDLHMQKYYPDYELHIISTAGAQSDDDAYQQGWKFLAGYMQGGAVVRFTDGIKSFDKEVTWYEHSKNYLDTIVDEHYYRSNDYLLENADRYNYYYRPYKDGKLVENQVSKVFVGEYASSDKNTLAGAIAEAAVMTGFENNSDVVRLAATAPLFNKVISDGSYRWTPDAIWFDNETLWRTPTYYVQQLFAKYIGTELLATSYETYEEGRKKLLRPQGGVSITIDDGVNLLMLTVTSNKTGEVLFEQDFAKPLDARLIPIAKNEFKGKSGYYLYEPDWSDYTVKARAEKTAERAGIYVGAGLSGVSEDHFSCSQLNIMEYCVGLEGHRTGLKVYKDGREGYVMGDYSSSIFAGNLRACYDEPVAAGKIYDVTVNYGMADGKGITCYYKEDGSTERKALLECKLEAYNRDLFHSVTRDAEHVYLKLVNAEEFDKKLRINLKEINAKEEAEVVVLTGAPELAHIPNVNTRDAEPVAPSVQTVKAGKDSLELTLPAYSLSVVIL